MKVMNPSAREPHGNSENRSNSFGLTAGCSLMCGKLSGSGSVGVAGPHDTTPTRKSSPSSMRSEARNTTKKSGPNSGSVGDMPNVSGAH